MSKVKLLLHQNSHMFTLKCDRRKFSNYPSNWANGG